MAQRELVIGDEYEGIVSGWINQGHGYGFIHVEGAPRDVFVSARDLENATDLRRGDRVRFAVRMNESGRLQASHCALFEDESRPVMPKVTTTRVETIFRAGRQIVIHREY